MTPDILILATSAFIVFFGLLAIASAIRQLPKMDHRTTIVLERIADALETYNATGR